ncbi:hypothetical protein [Acanthopleuribacter pedis]|uniref:Uncharacterized protein n=1 Tax=Acanthopleuribacter pedis TaxID=442870 RepID=A0A8J7U4U7_9BACT|nr:hypothetical protein [Acanthopleuribacter pedis]MBO1320159.1 hypothetical protein [Acanthopleuribacter pedis]
MKQEYSFTFATDEFLIVDWFGESYFEIERPKSLYDAFLFSSREEVFLVCKIIGSADLIFKINGDGLKSFKGTPQRSLFKSCDGKSVFAVEKHIVLVFKDGGWEKAASLSSGYNIFKLKGSLGAMYVIASDGSNAREFYLAHEECLVIDDFKVLKPKGLRRRLVSLFDFSSDGFHIHNFGKAGNSLIAFLSSSDYNNQHQLVSYPDGLLIKKFVDRFVYSSFRDGKLLLLSDSGKLFLYSDTEGFELKEQAFSVQGATMCNKGCLFYLTTNELRGENGAILKVLPAEYQAKNKVIFDILFRP